MGGGGSSSHADTTNQSFIRYADYVEVEHKEFLTLSAHYGDVYHEDSPYAEYTPLDFTTMFFGLGYSMSSFPSLFDMFGKFMAAIDVEAIYTELFGSVQNSDAVTAMSEAHAALLDDDIEQTVLPRFQEGMRDMNAVMTSSYVIGKSIIEQGRVKQLASYDAELRFRLLGVASDLLRTHLEWNKDVIKQYRDMMTLVVDANLQTHDKAYLYAAKDKLWPFTILAQERANLGALQGATSATTSAETEGPSTGASVIGGALGGAAMGASVGGPVGAGIGGLLGGVAGLL